MAAVLAVSTAGLAFSGSWSAELTLLPSVALSSSSLTLSGELSGWTIAGTGDWLGSDGWVWQEFSLKGNLFNTADVEWTLLFGPLAPAFLYSLGTAKFSYAGADFTLYSAMVGPNVPGYAFTGGPSGGMVIQVEKKIGDMTLSSITGIGAQLSDVSIVYTGAGTYKKTYPVDPFPGGLRFTYEKLSFTDMPFCCDISLDVTLSFTKLEGFAYLEITAENLIQLCCDIGLDATVKFTTTAKSVSLKPHWKGIQGCVEVYGNANWDAQNHALPSFELYGWKIVCQLADCNKLTLVTALDPDWYNANVENIFEDDEFEYIKLDTCGAACCGGNWSLSLAAYFQSAGTLFGLNRLAADLSFPLNENFRISASFTGSPTGGPSLSLGWTLSF